MEREGEGRGGREGRRKKRVGLGKKHITFGNDLSSVTSKSIQFLRDRGISSGARGLVQLAVSSEHTAFAESAKVSSYSYSPLAYLNQLKVNTIPRVVSSTCRRGTLY